MRRERFDLVIPCSEVEIGACFLHRRELEACGRVYNISDRVFEVLFDKARTSELARQVGVAVPRETVVTTEAEARSALDGWGFPLVLKPPRTLAEAGRPTVFTVRKAYDEEELRRELPPLLAAGPVVVQENVLGRGVGVDLLLNEGEPLLAFQHERVHEPLRGGPSSYRRSVPIDPRLLEASCRLLRPLRHTGVAMVEFRWNPATETAFLLEVNARFWGSLPLAVAAGADFPFALFRLLVHGQTSFPGGYRVGAHCRNWSRDLDWMRANFRADHHDPTLATRPWRKVIGGALWNLVTLREHSDTMTWDDPGPGLDELARLVRRTWAFLGT
jgi:predicted ATP-grasp superfamily ATP-dependent carboligase